MTRSQPSLRTVLLIVAVYAGTVTALWLAPEIRTGVYWVFKWAGWI
jgi:hypothetical protein